MRTESCKNGHYYSLDKHSTCPYCAESKPIFYENLNEETTILNMTKTKELRTEAIGSEVLELAGWIVIVSKQGKAKSYSITYGMNRIGRASTNEISIDTGDTSISREKHAVIIYDFENNLFFIQHHEGKYLTYVNGNMISNLTELKAHDSIKIGKTEFIFVPLCGDNFKWENYET